MACDNPECPVCRMQVIIQECAEAEIPSDAILGVIHEMVAEAYDGVEIAVMEVLEDEPASERAEILARQVQRARIPARLARVFPLRLGPYARFVPVAAALLAVVSLTDFTSPSVAPSAQPVDSELALEGRSEIG